MKERQINKRAEIIGVRKYGGCTILISDSLNNVTVFDVTFKDDVSFGTLDKNVLNNITKDLINYKSLLLPFINHADEFGDFSNKNILKQSMNTFIENNRQLFYF
jgi:hypothetical protein